MENSTKRSAVVVLATAVVLSSPVGGRPAIAKGAESVPAGVATARSAGEERDTVLVSGRGEVAAEPDTLRASLAAEVSASTVGEAVKRSGTAVTRMRDALVRAGMARSDLQTSTVSITPARKDDGVITGYTATQGLTAEVRDLPRAGALLSAAVAAGGDAARVDGVSFAIRDDSALLAEARRKAFADARTRAGLYAREAGRPLGRVLKVHEEDPGRWAADGQNRFAAADSTVVVEPGRLHLAVTVTVEWALDQPPGRSRKNTPAA
ncbi:SIMPL domain-containing protein [Actinoplanes sp. URMC 104]|uniref:SIMPL domain-containing protein n=1 Tax=Actinoplanes sp. URMC 104 TaxID=3423409 RepID=UPI003F1C8D49